MKYLEELYKIIEKRKETLPKNSYSAKLFKKGEDAVVRKIGEEATELIIAAKNAKMKEIISETADLIFNILLLLVYFNIKPQTIIKELKKRRINKQKNN